MANIFKRIFLVLGRKVNDVGERLLQSFQWGIDTSGVGQVDGQNQRTQDMYLGGGTNETC